MTITSAITDSFKAELLEGLHNCAGDAFKLALIVANPTGTYDQTITSYSQLGTDEIPAGMGYTQGGQTLTNSGVGQSGSQSYTSWGNALWSSSTMSPGGALLYNSSKSNRAICVLAFPARISTVNGSLSVVMPSLAPNTALIEVN